MMQRPKTQVNLWWPYLLLGIAILGPLWLPSYILTLDMVFVPHPPIPSELSASFPLYVALHYLSYLVPGDLLQKLLLFTILVTAGIGMDRLLRQLFEAKLSRWTIVAASLFYMTSAFVYERLMMGQWAVVAGYALLPFVVTALLRFLKTPTWRHTWWLVGTTLLLAVMSIHALLPAAIVGALLVAMHWRRWRSYTGKLAAGFGAFTVLSSYWLIPALLNANTIGAALRGSSDEAAFATNGGLFSLLRLQGVWGEAHGLFLLPQDIALLPGVWQTLIWATMAAGFIALWRQRRGLALLSLSLIVVSCLIALVGLGDMYREPHKIMIVAALAMTILGAVGIDTVLQRFKRTKPVLVSATGLFACAVPLLLSMSILWGFWGQLNARAYPPEWTALQNHLQALPNDKSAVFVPWHLYQRYSFSPRIVANPAPSFFEGRRIIINTDPEFAGVAPLRPDPLVTEVSRLLAERPNTIAAQLAQLGVGYVIFTEEPGYEDVAFLRETAGLKPVFQQGTVTLYEIEVTP